MASNTSRGQFGLLRPELIGHRTGLYDLLDVLEKASPPVRLQGIPVYGRGNTPAEAEKIEDLSSSVMFLSRPAASSDWRTGVHPGPAQSRIYSQMPTGAYDSKWQARSPHDLRPESQAPLRSVHEDTT
jgi:hypothetical protein